MKEDSTSALNTPESIGQSSRGQSADEACWYRMFGFAVLSEIRLPLPLSAEPPETVPAWAICRATGSPPPEPDWEMVMYRGSPDGTPYRAVRRGSGGTWIWDSLTGPCLVSPDARVVNVYPGDEDLNQMLGISLTGLVAIYILHRLGYPTLHASAVLTKGGAVAFLGDVGQGKSSMVAAFLRRGARFLTDDILPLRERDGQVLAGPGLPLLKLWPEAAQNALDLSDTDSLPRVVPPRLDAAYDKKMLRLDDRYSVVEEPVPLRAMYVLDRYSPSSGGDAVVTITPMGGREGLTRLMEQMSFGAFLRPMEVARFMPVYARLAKQAPVRWLRYPSGFEHQEAVLRAVMDDLSRDR